MRLAPRALDVLGDDPAVRPGAGEGDELDAALARHPAGERRGLDAAAGRAAARRRRLREPRTAPSRLAGEGSGSTVAAGSAAISDGTSEMANSSPRLADHRDRLPDRHLALGDRDLEQDAARLGLDLLRRLVGVELVERLALLDRVALGLEPA